ncbi:DUF692 domain-containing protein [Mesorhizobium sp. CA14]|nr:DUF692 domain-containing protein [Mesorhizobium sp. CA14]
MRARVGLAWSPQIGALISRDPDRVDYVEVPFERLRASEQLAESLPIPIILHCSSMSVGGDVAPTRGTLDRIRELAEQVDTPWIGEHLAFTSAHRFDDDGNEIVNTDYTICPQFSEESLERCISTFKGLQENFERRIILENPPQYFVVPGSTMSQTEFLSRLVSQTDVGLLLDLAHLYITARNFKQSPMALLDEYPTSRVVEVHVSGVSVEDGTFWDNHGIEAPEPVYSLLAALFERAAPEAVTLEFNWHSHFSESALLEKIRRVRELVS